MNKIKIEEQRNLNKKTNKKNEQIILCDLYLSQLNFIIKTHQTKQCSNFSPNKTLHFITLQFQLNNTSKTLIHNWLILVFVNITL